MDFGKLLLKLVGVAKDSIEDSNNDSRPKQQSRPSQSYTPPAVEKTFPNGKHISRKSW